MEMSKVKCRECKARATQYEGALPTRGVAKVLGIASVQQRVSSLTDRRLLSKGFSGFFGIGFRNAALTWKSCGSEITSPGVSLFSMFPYRGVGLSMRDSLESAADGADAGAGAWLPSSIAGSPSGRVFFRPFSLSRQVFVTQPLRGKVVEAK